jgi:hypothetical protein
MSTWFIYENCLYDGHRNFISFLSLSTVSFTTASEKFKPDQDINPSETHDIPPPDIEGAITRAEHVPKHLFKC